MKKIYLLLTLICTLSCNKDNVESPDANLFLGVWKLESTSINDNSITLTDCEKESTLLLYWFSEFDPTYNADIYNYGTDDVGDCKVIQEVIDATWIPLVNFDDSNRRFPEVKLRYMIENDTIALDMERQGELLTLKGQIRIDGEMANIYRTYRKLRQDIP